MDCRLILITLSMFFIIPSTAYAEPATIYAIVQSAGAAIGAAATSTTAMYIYASVATNYILNALTPQPQMPNFNSLGSSNGGATSQGTTSIGGYNISGIASAADHLPIVTEA